MNIEKKRAEILRLIARVNREHGVGVARDGASPSRHGSASGGGAAIEQPRKPAPDDRDAARVRVERRRQQLSELRALRERLEASRPVPEVIELLRALDRRVAAIEEILLSGQLPAAGAEPSLPPDHAFGGILREGLLADMLQLVSSNMMSGEFVISGQGVEVHLYFHEGEIFHGEGPDMVGESAVFCAMALERGRYYFLETDQLPEQRSIESKTQFLILEALRRVDEERAQ